LVQKSSCYTEWGDALTSRLFTNAHQLLLLQLGHNHHIHSAKKKEVKKMILHNTAKHPMPTIGQDNDRTTACDNAHTHTLPLLNAHPYITDDVLPFSFLKITTTHHTSSSHHTTNDKT
jgi:hypothetical protein